MHNPLVIENDHVDRGHYRWRLEPALYRYMSIAEPILFLLCLFLGTGGALCLLLDILALLFTAEFATGGVRIADPLLLLVVL